MTGVPKLLSSLVKSLRPVPNVRLFSVSSPALFRRPLDLEEDHMESMSLGEDHGDMFAPAMVQQGQREKSVNSVTLLGRVGMEPAMRGSEEQPVTTFSLATNSYWKSAGETEWRNKTEWHNIVVFKPGLREVAFNNITKGTRLHVTGKLTYGKYVDRNGVERQTTSIICDDFIFLSKK